MLGPQDKIDAFNPATISFVYRKDKRLFSALNLFAELLETELTP